MAVEKFAVISQQEAMQSHQPNAGGEGQQSKDLTSRGIRGFTLWNRGEQVVGGAVGVGALALGAVPLAIGAGVWVGWNEFQIRVANGYDQRRKERKAGAASKSSETTVFQRARELYVPGARKA